MNIGVIFAGGVGSRMHSKDRPKQFLDIYQYRLNKVKKIVPGGKTGQLSIYNGLIAAQEIARDEENIVLIHDGVRPLINEELIKRNIQDVKDYGSSITSGIVKETIVEIYDNNDIKLVPDRAHSRVAKAPQCFWLKDILSAHKKAMNEQSFNFIDSCSMMKYYGYKLHMTDGPYENIKITTPDDFYMMRAVLQAKEDAQLYTPY